METNVLLTNVNIVYAGIIRSYGNNRLRRHGSSDFRSGVSESVSEWPWTVTYTDETVKYYVEEIERNLILIPTHLIPWISSPSWMNENADEFRPWKECKRSFGNLFTVKVIGTLLEHNMSCSIVWKWKVLHVPTHKNKNHLIILCTHSTSGKLNLENLKPC